MESISSIDRDLSPEEMDIMQKVQGAVQQQSKQQTYNIMATPPPPHPPNKSQRDGRGVGTEGGVGWGGG